MSDPRIGAKENGGIIENERVLQHDKRRGDYDIATTVGVTQFYKKY